MHGKWLLALTAVMMLSGCIEGGAETNGVGTEGDPSGDTSDVSQEAPFILEWDGYVAAAPVDVFMHIRPTEDVLYEVQPAGFSLDVTGEPTAIEVMIQWEGDGAFVLHPHYVVDHEAELGGDTEYYGYLSDTFEESGGCMQIPVEDVVAGQWQMMIHPRDNNMVDTSFTITMGVLGGEAEEREEFHGHRWDGDTIMEDHGYDACSFLPALVE